MAMALLLIEWMNSPGVYQQFPRDRHHLPRANRAALPTNRVCLDDFPQ